MTWAKRTDSNHQAIGNALRRLGFMVLDLSRVGSGCPDYLVHLGSFWALVEVKTEKGKLRREQLEFQKTWPVTVIRTLEDVVRLRQQV